MLFTTTAIVENGEDSEFDVEVTIEWNVQGRYVSPRLWGPPERCYEAEYPEYDIEQITVTEFGRAYQIREADLLQYVSFEDLRSEAIDRAAAIDDANEPDYEADREDPDYSFYD